jgi:hypothetical protein
MQTRPSSSVLPQSAADGRGENIGSQIVQVTQQPMQPVFENMSLAGFSDVV